MGFYRQFLSLRFRFYIWTSGQLLLRRWQWLLVAGLFTPGLLLAKLTTLPEHFFNSVASTDIGYWARCGLLLVGQAIAVLWVLPQSVAVRGGDFRNFSFTLPLPKMLIMAVTTSLLMGIDSVLFIPAFVGFVSPFSGAANIGPARIDVLLAATLNFLLIQLGIIERARILFLASAVAVLPLSLAFGSTGGLSHWALIVCSSIVPLATLIAPNAELAASSNRPYVIAWIRKVALASVAQAASPTLRIQIKALAERPFAVLTVFASTIAAAVGFDSLISAFSYDDRSLPTIIGAMATSAFLLSSLYRHLSQSHPFAESFMVTLPLNRRYWMWKDIVLITSLGILPALMLAEPILAHGLASPFVATALVIGSLALLAGLRVTLVSKGRFSVMFSISLAIAWASSAIAAVAP